MPNSYAVEMTLTCPKTKQPFTFKVWQIIDTSERPDLAQRICDGTLNSVVSPFTGEEMGEVDAPLLILQPDQQHPTALFYSPAESLTPEENETKLHELVQMLQQSLGKSWQDAWVAMGLPIVDAYRLPMLVCDNPKAYLERLAERMDNVSGQIEDPINFIRRRAEIDMQLLAFADEGTPSGLDRIILWQKMLDLMAKAQNPLVWAQLKTDIGNTLIETDLNGENIEASINLYSQALEVYRREILPEKWAEIQHNLGNMFYRRTRGDWLKNFEMSLDCYANALEIREKSKYPQAWSRTQFGLGGAYFYALVHKKGIIDNVADQAISHFRQTLEVVRNETSFMWGEAHKSLGECYSDRVLKAQIFKLDASEDGNQAIVHYQQSLKYFTSEQFPEQCAYIHFRLAIAYLELIKEPKQSNLDTALRYCNEGISLLADHPRTELWANLQFILSRILFERNRNITDDTMEKAICHSLIALRYHRNYHAKEHIIGEVHSFLTLLYNRRQSGKEYRNREIAICHGKKATNYLSKNDQPESWGHAYNNLASAYAKRIRGNRAENLETAIQLYKMSLDVFDRNESPINWAMIHDNLVSTYRDRIKGEKHQNLEDAIYHGKLALSVRKKDTYPEEWAKTVHGIGIAFSDRLIDNRSQNLEQAISHFKDALLVFERSNYPEDWAEVTHNLVAVYTNRIVGDRAENLEIALKLGLDILQMRSFNETPKQWADTQSLIGLTYRDRIDGKLRENSDLALHHYAQALDVYNIDHFPDEWAETLHGLATVHYIRSRDLGFNEIDEAIGLFNQALQIRTLDNNPEAFAITQNNLANCYALIKEDNKNLISAISHYHEAFRVRNRLNYPERWAELQNNLGIAYAALRTEDREANIKQAIHHYREALTVYTSEHFPIWNRNTLNNLAHLYFAESQWEEGYQIYLRAIQVGTELFDYAYSDTGRIDAIKETRLLYVRAAYCALQLGKYEESLMLLEVGKARLLSEALSLDNKNLNHINGKERSKLSSLSEQIKQLEYEYRLPTPLDAKRDKRFIASELGSVRTALRELLEQLRSQYTEFMSDLTLSELLSLIPKAGALVVPLFTVQGSAIFVLPNGMKHVTKSNVIMLNKFTTQDLHAITRSKEDNLGWLSYYIEYRFNNANLRTLFDGISDVTQRLWDALIGDIYNHLQELDIQNVLLIPQGDANLVPLHAAWRMVDGAPRYFIDEFTITYAPSMASIASSMHKPIHGEGALVAGVSEYDRLGNLPNTRFEAESIASLFKTSPMLNKEVTVLAIQEAAHGKAFVHLCCHGAFGWGGDVFSSRLYFADDEVLQLSDIIAQLDLSSVQLVVLSACETGIVDFNNIPDEFLGLPSGFIQAGASAVISSLWTVEDRSTALLMEHMYKKILDEKNPMYPAQALREAQFWLRNVTAKELGEHYQSYLIPRMNQREAADAFIELMKQFQPNDKPYAHPFYWAAFIYNGV